MRITIIEPKPEEEDEIIVKCRAIDEDLMDLLNLLRQGAGKSTVTETEIFIPLTYRKSITLKRWTRKYLPTAGKMFLKSKAVSMNLKPAFPRKNFCGRQNP